MPSKDPEKIREKNRRYREAHRVELNAKAREKAKTPEGRAKLAEYQRRFDAKNPGKRAEYLRNYRAAHRPEGWKPFVPKGPMGDASDERHGTANGYSNLKCRCDKCRSAWAAHMRDYKARRRNKNVTGNAA